MPTKFGPSKKGHGLHVLVVVTKVIMLLSNTILTARCFTLFLKKEDVCSELL